MIALALVLLGILLIGAGVMRARARRIRRDDMRHILGAQQWWGKR